MEEINYWNFKNELLKIPAKTKKLTNKTARLKVEEVLKKYEKLISYNENQKNRYEKMYFELQKIFDAKKSGIIKYDGGWFLVSEILKIKVKNETVIVTFKNNSEMNFTMDFEWILKLYN